MPRKKVTLSDIQPYDPQFHDVWSRASKGVCSWHGGALSGPYGCNEPPVISFRHRNSRFSGCKRVIEEQELQEEVKKWEHLSTGTPTGT